MCNKIIAEKIVSLGKSCARSLGAEVSRWRGGGKRVRKREGEEGRERISLRVHNLIFNPGMKGFSDDSCSEPLEFKFFA